jgi:hypothetical protein
MSRSRTKKKAGQNQGQKPAAPHSPGVQKKDLKASDFYAQNLQRLEVLRGQQKDALRQARQQQLWEQERQKASASSIQSLCQRIIVDMLSPLQPFIKLRASAAAVQRNPAAHIALLNADSS